MRLLTNSRYGTRMVLDIAQHGKSGPVRMRDIAKRQGISQKYLEKIVQVLKKGGYIKSVRGPRGGHFLAKPLSSVSIGEIVRILEGDNLLVECTKSAEHCAQAPGCLTRMVWKVASEAMFAALDNIKLDDLVRFANQGIQLGDSCDLLLNGMGEPEAGKAAVRAKPPKTTTRAK